MNYHLRNKDITTIENHYEKHFTNLGAKNSGKIIHEIFNDDMHIDIAYYQATDEFPFQILATIGMSGYTMDKVPYKNIELIMFLPKDWQIENMNNPRYYWPIQLLRIAARLPYGDNTALTYGHTISYDKDNTPFDESTEMCTGLIVFPEWIDHSIFNLTTGSIFSKKTVNFLCLTTINQEEFNIIKEKGVDYLIDNVLKKHGTLDLVVRNTRNI